MHWEEGAGLYLMSAVGGGKTSAQFGVCLTVSSVGLVRVLK